ncbi:MAG: hypothetical protein WC657_02850 [Candidatus Paceibacterota bacterium]|jgi:hypothetical protein
MSLLEADLEEREKKYRKNFQKSGIILAMVVPAALGCVFPFFFIGWLGLSGAICFWLDAPSAFPLVLGAIYLLASAIVWVALEFCSRRIYRHY